MSPVSETGPPAVRLRVPGDKSVGHRALIVAALAPGPMRVEDLPDATDVRSTARALAAVGVRVAWPEGAESARVAPPGEWRHGASIDAGNSGTTARLLTGLFAGLGLAATIDGDASLRERPMDRVVYPLQAMGARIEYVERTERLPIRLAHRATGHLRVLRYRSRIASAQVKGALVFAALAAGVEFEMWEPARSRDHTERLLRHLGVPIEFGPEERGAHLKIPARAREHLRARAIRVPGDPSSAAFLLAAGVLAGRPVSVEGILLNETRTKYLEVLEAQGAEVEIELSGELSGEPVGKVTAGPGPRGLSAVDIGPEGMAGLIDEVPILAVLAAKAEGVTTIRGAGELRLKESDRLAALAANLSALGIEARETRDGLAIHGRPDLVPAGRVPAFGDHRIAMAFGALGAVAGADLRVDDPSCAAISYPGFWADLEKVTNHAG